MIKRIIRKLHRTLFGEPPEALTDAEILFVEENQKFWQARRRGRPTDAFVLVEWVNHDAILLSNAAMAAIAAEAGNLKILFLVKGSGKKTRYRRLMESYPHAHFENIASLRARVYGFLARRNAKKLLANVTTPEALLTLKLDGIPFGDLIYDSYLGARGYATVREINSEVRAVAEELLTLKYLYEDIIRRYSIKTSVVSQMMGIYPGVLAKCLLKEGIEILNRVGSHQIFLRKYHGIESMGNHPCTPASDVFDRMLHARDEVVQTRAKDYIETRLGGGIGRLDAALAFSKEKKIYTDRAEFCTDFNLNPDYPVVFVMLHAFNDYPHWNYPRRMIHLDYYHWFVHTLECARKINGVNWIIKEHPTQKYYPTHDLNLDEFMERYKGQENIRFLNAEFKFNTSSLRYIAHAIVTGGGTAGLEFSNFGVPTVLAGEGAYSGFGFTHEPRTPQEHEEFLTNIRDLPRLTEDQIRRARLIAYFFFCVANDHIFHFCPPFHDDELSAWRPEFREILWGKASAAFRDSASRALLEKQASDIADFCRDKGRIQWLDYSLHPYLAPEAQ